MGYVCPQHTMYPTALIAEENTPVDRGPGRVLGREREGREGEGGRGRGREREGEREGEGEGGREGERERGGSGREGETSVTAY